MKPRVQMTIEEAKTIATEILKIPGPVFERAKRAAKDMSQMKAEHWPPMSVALALLGVAKSHEVEDMEGELTDALALVGKAENEYRLRLRSMQ
jgi:hypothetical protein